jgi:hypothetical protein
MKYDWKKIKAAIKKDTESIRMSKADGFHGGALNSQKREATLHHAIAAHAHHHIHLSGKFLCDPYRMNLSPRRTPCYLKQGMSMEEQEKFIEKELSSFIVQEPPVENVAKTA